MGKVEIFVPTPMNANISLLFVVQQNMRSNEKFFLLY